jgi:RNA polymerase sigma-70 factor (ECF subfamily)
MKLDQVLKQYTHQLKRFFRSRVRNASDADDLVQEVFKKTLVHFKNIKEPEKFRSWLFSVARNTLIDHYRKTARYVNDEFDSAVMELEEPGEAAKELSKCIRPFLRQLPEEYRRALEEVELNDKSQKQLANDLGMTYSALKSRVQRGREMLRDLFHECCQYQLDVRGGIVDYKMKKMACGSCEKH